MRLGMLWLFRFYDLVKAFDKEATITSKFPVRAALKRASDNTGDRTLKIKVSIISIKRRKNLCILDIGPKLFNVHDPFHIDLVMGKI